MNLGRAIRAVRQLRGMSQADLAVGADVSSSHISQIEAGKRDPSVGLVSRIASTLGITTSVLMLIATDQDDFPADKREIGEALAELVRRELYDIFSS